MPREQLIKAGMVKNDMNPPMGVGVKVTKKKGKRGKVKKVKVKKGY
jgi:hypothetical protein